METAISPVVILCLAFVITLTLCASACAAAWPVAHPVTEFGGEKTALRKRVAPIQNLDDTELRARYEKQASVLRASYPRTVGAAIGLWEATGDAAYRDLAVKACTAALGDLASVDDGDLRSRVSRQGVQDDRNVRMRDAAHLFALLYRATGEKSHARKAAVILARFAEQLPHWPIYVPHIGPWEDRTRYPQDEIVNRTEWDTAGFWGVWIYQDILGGVPLLDAYDLIYNAGVMQETGVLESVERMLRAHTDLQFGYGRRFTNMDPTQMRGILTFAKVLGQPEWVHGCVQWIVDIYKTQYYADGWWHEGTPSYHKQAHHGFKGVADRYLKGYSDPEGFVSEQDGTRFDNLDLDVVLERPFSRAQHALDAVQQPNRICQVIHDTTFPQSVWWTPPIEAATSYLFGCTGHAILGAGRGEGNMVQATLHYGGTHGHEHLDCLNLILFAKDRELLSETRYRPMDVKNTTREWHTQTAGHITVVVDGKDQTSRGDRHTPKRQKQPEDEIPGIPDWPWRWGGHGNVLNDGRLRLYNTDFDMVQVAEADAERAYGSLVNLDVYRRTVVLVKISDTDVYVVDLFRVKGGKTHDYMLHACLEVPHRAAFSLPVETERDGTLHKYIADLKTARTDDPWDVTFTLDDGSAALKTFFLPQPGTEIICGEAPAMRRNGTAPFVAVRQSDGESLFAAVHHPYKGAPLVQKVELVPLDPSDASAIAIRVTLPDRTDTITATTGEHAESVRTRDGKIELRGRFAHIAEGVDNWAYLIDGDRLITPEKEITGRTSHTGAIHKTHRIEAGDATDAFVTQADLPADGSLNDRTLMVDEGGQLVQAFRVRTVETKNGETLIHSHDEPGMTVTPGLVKLEYFPNWGISGEARFRIAGSALLRADGAGRWTLAGSGDVSGAVGGKRVERE